ncbi:MAG: alkaline phosphatase family protein [Kiritimatiellae bacterium]|nr:alkaline phosphatase family protein [Kiritimatiellia bacterium]
MLMEQCCLAYIGPGAGFAFTGAFLTTLAAIASIMTAFLTVFLRRTVKAVRRRFWRSNSPPKTIIIGFDGLDPRIAKNLIQHNRLPNMRRLMESGTFSELQSTMPPLSPVAWSSFITGVNPGKHNVYDFLRRDPASYRILPALAASDDFIQSQRNKKNIRLHRKSTPFWNLLSKASVPSFVFRVPATFPVEPFENMRLLAGMGIPDLRGTQGLFTCFEAGLQSPVATQNGERIPLEPRNGCLEGILAIQKDADNQWTVTINLKPEGNNGSVCLFLPGCSVALKPRVFSEWVRIPFRKGLGKFYGIARFCLLSGFPDVRLYVTPLHMDPSRPVIPLAVPRRYSIELANEHGLFGTLGMAEDTGALMDGVLDPDLFLKQTYNLQTEREDIFLDEIRQTPDGFCMGVFDFTDRIQHMFFGGNADDYPWGNNQSDIVATAYERADEFLGRILTTTGNKSLVFVLSDHGFEHFKKGFNLNAWLQQSGLLAAAISDNREYLQSIDWQATQAYAFGLNSLFLNRIGREGKGIVSEAEAESLIRFISENLLKVKDPETGQSVISNVYSAKETYHGPYMENSPDLIIGYAPGYRVAWQSGRGGVGRDLFEYNSTPWTGDHCMDPKHVPGVFLSNHQFNLQKQPHLTDIAPSVLNAFNIPMPDYMDGHVI